MDNRPGWDTYFLAIAAMVAARGDCRRKQVGAVLVWDQRIWATGVNGTRGRKVPGCLEGACPRGMFSYEELPGHQQGNHNYNNCISIHAEMNAVQQWDQIADVVLAAGAAPDPILYVSTRPCDGCAAVLESRRIEPRWRL
jgi:dCMP deaminase